MVIPPLLAPTARPSRARETRPGLQRRNRSGRRFLLDLLVVLAGDAGLDLDPARLHGFRQLSYQVDVQQPILERCAFHLDVVGEIELAPERTAGDALVEVRVITLVRLAAFNGDVFCSLSR